MTNIKTRFGNLYKMRLGSLKDDVLRDVFSDALDKGVRTDLVGLQDIATYSKSRGIIPGREIDQIAMKLKHGMEIMSETEKKSFGSAAQSTLRDALASLKLVQEDLTKTGLTEAHEAIHERTGKLRDALLHLRDEKTLKDLADIAHDSAKGIDHADAKALIKKSHLDLLTSDLGATLDKPGKKISLTIGDKAIEIDLSVAKTDADFEKHIGKQREALVSATEKLQEHSSGVLDTLREELEHRQGRMADTKAYLENMVSDVHAGTGQAAKEMRGARKIVAKTANAAENAATHAAEHSGGFMNAQTALLTAATAYGGYGLLKTDYDEQGNVVQKSKVMPALALLVGGGGLAMKLMHK